MIDPNFSSDSAVESGQTYLPINGNTQMTDGMAGFVGKTTPAGSSTLYGTDAVDRLRTTPSQSTLYGLDGGDRLQGLAQADILFGNEGDDRLWGDRGNDWLNGGAGGDRLLGSQGNDWLVGLADADWLWGSTGRDYLNGGSGSDRLFGGSGDDQLAGGTGRDRQWGGQGDDQLVDVDGGDRLTGGQGADQFWVGSGETAAASVITDFEVGVDQLKILRLGAEFTDLTLRDRGRNTEILDQGRAIAILQGIRPSSLSSEDFIFGDAQQADRLQQTLDQVIQGVNAPGAALTAIAADGTRWTGSSGLADLATGQAVRPDDRFNIASITKPIVAATVLQLVQEGRLGLTDTLDQWLPDVAGQLASGDRVTVEQLLNMTSGIPDYTVPLVELADPSLLQRRWTSPELLDLIADQPAQFEPGEQFDYSNTNYLLLGEIIEQVAGAPLVDVLRDRIFDPLGMTNTFYAPQETVPGGFTQGYFDFDGDGVLDNTQDNLSWTSAAGGVVSTTADIARFAQGLFKGELLAPDTLSRMLTGGGNFSDQFTYGLGALVADDPNLGTFWGHNGGSFGWSSWMIYLPEQDVTVVGFLNRGPTLEEEEQGAGAVDVLALQALQAIAQPLAPQ
ncbi:MAG: serine hydrolase [Synechococcales bacterium]|nr:serine hydrolase [Synechococcales bacterium]